MTGDGSHANNMSIWGGDKKSILVSRYAMRLRVRRTGVESVPVPVVRTSAFSLAYLYCTDTVGPRRHPRIQVCYFVCIATIYLCTDGGEKATPP
jgi:hypothetical protein